MKRVIISGVGTEIPEAEVTNEQLVESYNAWAGQENVRREADGEALLQMSDASFIEQASGIKARRMLFPEGVLDPGRMAPRIPPRADDDLSVMAEFGAKAAKRALEDSGLKPGDIDMVICSASHNQRPYPAIAIEIQNALGMAGAAFDMGLGCSSSVAGMHVAFGLVRSGAQKRVMVVTPEIITGHLDFRDRQTHFIFGDAASAVILEEIGEGETRPGRFEVLRTRAWTRFSSNIRTDFGFLLRAGQDDVSAVRMEGNLIRQAGNKVFREVTVAAHRFIVDFLRDQGLEPAEVRRFWLHQANARMNAMILKLVLGREADQDVAPTVLERLGNTAAAGSVIALKENHADMVPGETGLLCAFGAGYSIGGSLLRMM